MKSLIAALLLLVGCSRSPGPGSEPPLGHEVGNGGDPAYIKVEHGRTYAGFLVERIQRGAISRVIQSQWSTAEVEWFFSHQQDLVEVLRDPEKLRLVWVDSLPGFCKANTWACLKVGSNELYLLRGRISDSATYRDTALVLIHEAVHVVGDLDDTRANRIALLASRAWEEMGHPDRTHWSQMAVPSLAGERITDDPLLNRNHYVDYDGKLRVWDERSLHSYDPATDAWAVTKVTENRFDWKRSQFNGGGGAHQGLWLAGYGIVFVPCYVGYPTLAPDASAVKLSGADGKWYPVSRNDAPSPRSHAGVVKSADRMVVWGGGACESIPHMLADGGIYDPVSDAWSPISAEAPHAPTPRRDHGQVWTSRGLAVWGGFSMYQTPGKPGFAGPVADGGFYDPHARRWEPIVQSDHAPSPRLDPLLVWTGESLVVYGGFGEYNRRSLEDGGVYDPRTQTWQRIAPPPAKLAPAGFSRNSFSQNFAFWSGSQVVFVSEGAVLFYDLTTQEWKHYGRALGPKFGSYSGLFWTGFEGILWNLEDRIGSLLYL